jgi:hypothetical protein
MTITRITISLKEQINNILNNLRKHGEQINILKLAFRKEKQKNK